MREIMTFMKQKEVDGFTVQPGFVGIMENGYLVAVTSGWEINNELRVYRKVADQWLPYWEDVYEDEAGSLYDALDDYQKMAEIWDAVRYLNKNKPKVLTAPTKLWDGEGWTEYNPVKGLPGVYLVTWKDSRLHEEYKALTVKDYRKMNKLS